MPEEKTIPKEGPKKQDAKTTPAVDQKKLPDQPKASITLTEAKTPAPAVEKQQPKPEAKSPAPEKKSLEQKKAAAEAAAFIH